MKWPVPVANPPSARTPYSGVHVPPAIRAAILLVLSNVFMTFAWYGHLRNLQSRPWFVAAVITVLD